MFVLCKLFCFLWPIKKDYIDYVNLLKTNLNKYQLTSLKKYFVSNEMIFKIFYIDNGKLGKFLIKPVDWFNKSNGIIV